MKDIFRFFSIFTSKQKKECIFLVIIMLIGAMLESLGIGAILPMISLLGQSDFLITHPDIATMARTIGITNHTELIIAGTLILILLYVAKNLYVAAEIYIQRRFAMKYQVIYSRELMSIYLLKPYTFHVNHNTAHILRNVNTGANMLFNYMFMPICYLISELVTAIAILIMIIVVDACTAVVVAGIMSVIIVAIIRFFRKIILKQGQLQNDASVEYLKWINQGLGAIKETKILRRESFFLSEFSASYKTYAKAVQTYGFIADLPRIIIELLVVCGLLFLILGKVLYGDNPNDIIPLLGVLAMAAFRLMPSANRIVGFYNSIKNQIPFFNEIYDVLLEVKYRLSENRNDDLNYNEECMEFNDKVQIQKVSFKYPDCKEEILNELSLVINKGKFIGIVGPSGAGKTTFVDILLGLLVPTEGKILCDKQDIKDNIRAWQANLAYVPQDIYLLDGSIRENIALGVSVDDIDDDLMYKVLDMSELTEFVNSLPDGWDTFVGERGVKLSGGQRQRIGIARALYQKPEILVLDEATSALDNETEKSITDTILKFKGKITIIAIAHRVSTLEQCDYKIKLEAGKAEIVH